MYERILVALDLSLDADRALPVAESLACRVGARLEVVSITSPGIDPVYDDSETQAHAHAAGVRIDDVRLRYDDDVVAGILAEAAVGDSLLCCATHARGSFADLLFNSVSADLVRGSPTPLLLVGPEVVVTPRPRFAEVLACISGGPFSDHVAQVTAAWARLLSAKTRVLEVVEPAIGSSGVDPYPAAERVAVRLGQQDLDVTWALVRGEHEADRILEEAAQMDGPLLVVAARDGDERHRHHGPSAAFGHVSRAVVQHSPHPVLVVPRRVRPPCPHGE